MSMNLETKNSFAASTLGLALENADVLEINGVHRGLEAPRRQAAGLLNSVDAPKDLETIGVVPT